MPKVEREEMTNILINELHINGTSTNVLALQTLALEAQSVVEAQMRRCHLKNCQPAKGATGLSQLDGLLQSRRTRVSLNNIARSARSLGNRLVVEIRDQQPVRIIQMG